eukprot:m.175521 g.175521  ORF g.175521 m.175521 type:complete len:209 (+) comp15429_c1_seq2:136-762(+)
MNCCTLVGMNYMLSDMCVSTATSNPADFSRKSLTQRMFGKNLHPQLVVQVSPSQLGEAETLPDNIIIRTSLTGMHNLYRNIMQNKLCEGYTVDCDPFGAGFPRCLQLQHMSYILLLLWDSRVQSFQKSNRRKYTSASETDFEVFFLTHIFPMLFLADRDDSQFLDSTHESKRLNHLLKLVYQVYTYIICIWIALQVFQKQTICSCCEL